MKSDQEIMNSIRAAIDDCTRGIDNAPSLQYQIARKAKGEEPVVKKISTTVILVAALLAITVVALAAGSLIFGWVDFYKDGYNVDVPDAARQIMTNNDQDITTLGPVTFTVREKYIDPWTALTSTVVTLNNSSNALLTGDDPFDAIGANGENGKAVAQRLGVDPMTTWAEAAKKLNLTLYSVSAELEVPEELSGGEVMGDVMFNEDGSVTYFCMPLLNGTAKGDSVDCQIYLRVLEVNVDDPENQPDPQTINKKRRSADIFEGRRSVSALRMPSYHSKSGNPIPTFDTDYWPPHFPRQCSRWQQCSDPIAIHIPCSCPYHKMHYRYPFSYPFQF